jgi:hypothetical protein
MVCFHPASTEGPFFGLGKEVENDGLFKPRTSTIKEDFTTLEIKTPTKGIVEPKLDAMPHDSFGTKLLSITYVYSMLALNSYTKKR